jgi:pyochelin biosynthetic protein PchC
MDEKNPRGISMGQPRWTVIFQPKPSAKLRLICFPHAGGAASAFADWPSMLQSDVEVVSVQLPARENRFAEPPVKNADQVLDALLKELPTSSPYVLFGHSLGAAMAYLLAWRLEQEGGGIRPRRLIISSGVGPSRWRELAEKATADVQTRDFGALLKAMGGTPADVHSHTEMMPILMRSFVADHELAATLPAAPTAALDIPFTTIRGTEELAITARDEWEWGGLSTRDIHCCAVPGGHFHFREGRAAFFSTMRGILDAELRSLT